MKSVFMILFLLSGLAMSSLNAQSCAPCPPGCCVVSCCAPGKNGAAASVTPGSDATLTAFSPEAMQVACGDKKMTRKEMKACQVACQIACSSAPKDQSHVAPGAASVHQTSTGTPSCQPASCQTASKFKSSSATVVHPQTSAQKVSSPAKS